LTCNNGTDEFTINVSLSRARVCDIVRINEMMFYSLSYWEYTQAELNKIMKLYSLNEEYLLNNHVYLAYSHEIFIGFFGLIKTNNHGNELDYFLIKKDLIGFGYGYNMWKACCDKAKSLMIKDFVILSTPDAEGFYIKMGAKRIDAFSSEIRKGVMLPLLKFVNIP
jgi:N-acetylglutamate synthase-like GNAT family acetyltransferase